jgi:SAM-dependent methyltransferase
VNEIDWNTKFRERMIDATTKRYDVDIKTSWNNKAKSYMDGLKYNQEATDKVLSLIHWDEDDTIIDIGCGPGTLTIPMAKTSKKVTAIDASDEMLKFLKIRAEKEGLDNIVYEDSYWEDANLLPHDIVVAYQSLIMPDMKTSLKKMNDLAKKRVYLFRFTDRMTHFHKVWNLLTDEEYNENPDYVYIVNILHDLGIYADVKIYEKELNFVFDSFEKAEMTFRAKFPTIKMDSKNKQIINKYLCENLVNENDKYLLKRNCTEAMIYWNK